MTTEEQEKVDKLVEDALQEKEKEQKTMAVATTSNNLSTPMTMPDYVPEIDKTKDLDEQASDVVQLMGAQQASQNKTFMDKVSDNFQKGVLTDQEVKNMKKARLLEEEYFIKWQDALSFVFIKSPHGINFMRIMTVVAMLFYIPMRIVGMLVKSIGMLGDFVNEIFNSVFGGKGKYLRDKDGNVIVNPQTKKPYMEQQGYNLFAKILFGIIIIGLALALVLIFVKIFTGFDVFDWFRTLQ